MIVTIDGPVATGKSSIAKKLAEEMGFIYFDTGAMYRALTYAINKNNINPDDPRQLSGFLDHFDFDFKIKQGERRYFLGKDDVTEAIRRENVTALVSKISALRPVREKLVQIQRELAIGVNAVFEGRDMGSVVFPDADLKIFLTGRPEIRAKRRYEELLAKLPDEAANLTLEKCLEEITKRDAYDSNREISPLRQAEDAFVIDTSHLTIDEIVFRILELKDQMRTKYTPPVE